MMLCSQPASPNCARAQRVQAPMRAHSRTCSTDFNMRLTSTSLLRAVLVTLRRKARSDLTIG